MFFKMTQKACPIPIFLPLLSSWKCFPDIIFAYVASCVSMDFFFFIKICENILMSLPFASVTHKNKNKNKIKSCIEHFPLKQTYACCTFEQKWAYTNSWEQPKTYTPPIFSNQYFIYHFPLIGTNL